jgi:putative redox protein
MKVCVKWLDHMSFVGETGSGHSVVMDGAPDFGGRDLAPRPMEMLLLGLGGCTAFDVVMILKKARQSVTDCRVEVEAERAETEPKVFTRIHVHYVVTGRDVQARHVERAVKLSAEKYCSASVMLGATAEITHDFQVLEACPAEDA